MSLKIVADNSDAEIAKRRAQELLGYPLRDLTANLIRLARGGGHAYRLPSQIAAVVKAYNEFGDAYGHYPTDEVLRSELDPDESWRRKRASWLRPNETQDEGRRLEHLREAIAAEVRDASMQMVASMLLCQIPQEAQAQHDFWRNFYALRDAHDEMRAHYDAKFSTRRPKLTKRRPRTTKAKSTE